MSEIFETIQIMRKNLGPVTAYKYAVQQGYTGTEQEFAALMASYATVAEEAESAKDDAIDAKTAAEAAQAAAEAAAEQAEGAIEVDDTLSKSGRAADAKITGERLDYISGKQISFTLEIKPNTTETLNIDIEAGRTITISGGADVTSQRLSFYYADGTSITNIAVKTGINYRPQKDVTKITLYNGSTTNTYSYTVVISGEKLKETNFFDPSAISEGYINGGSIQSGYYHSDYIPVAIGDTIIAPAYPGTFGSARIWLYNADHGYKTYISGVLREDGLYEFDLPLSIIGDKVTVGDVYYAAFNLLLSKVQEVKFYINTVPNVPLEYGQVLPDADLFYNAQQKSYIDSSYSDAKLYTDDSMGNIVTHETSDNKFDPNSELTELNTFWQNGKTTLSNYVTSNPVPVKTGDVILCNLPTSSMYNNYGAYVTADKTYISMINSGNCTIDDDGNVKHIATRDGYVSFNTRTSALQSTMIVVNADMPESYEQYKDEYVFTDKVNVTMSGTQSPLKGKRIAYNGDSICESRLTEGSANNGGAYAKLISDIVSGTYENRAISGGILASAVPSGNLPARCVVSDVENMTDDADLICFEGGINDYWRSVPLGDYSESDYSGTLDTTTVCGALESIFRQATTKWVGKPIVFVIVHKIKSTVYAANTAGYTFAQAREKMIGICNKYAIPYYDAFVESGLNAYNSIQNNTFLVSNSTGDPDGCHPNEAAYQRFYVPQLISLFESVMPRI